MEPHLCRRHHIHPSGSDHLCLSDESDSERTPARIGQGVGGSLSKDAINAILLVITNMVLVDFVWLDYNTSKLFLD
jgi:hypothetical protein